MSTAPPTTSVRRRMSLDLGRFLMLSSVVAVAVLQPGAAGAGTTTFARWISTHTGNVPSSVAVADFDGDGELDVATGGNDVVVMLGTGDGRFDHQTDYETPSYYTDSVAVGDFDADGSPDLVAASTDGDQVWVRLGSSDGTFGDPTAYGAGENPGSVAADDLNRDGDLDLVVANRYQGTVSVLLGGPGGTFGAATAFPAGEFPVSVVTSDVDGDSDVDLAVSNGGTLSVLLGNGDGSFGPRSSRDVGDLTSTFSAVAAGDFNGDSDPDLAVVGDQVGVVILLGGAGGTFTTAQTVAPVGDFDTSSVRDIAVADFNEDSHPDLGLAGPGFAVLDGDGDGTFSNLRTFSTNGAPVAAAVGDFNADDLPDVAVANYWSVQSSFGDVAVLLNAPDTTAPNTTIAGGPSGPTNDVTPTFTFTSSETDSTFECRVDDSVFSACTSPHTPPGLDDGPHTFGVRAIDGAGNVDATPASRSFTVDTVAPDTTITGGPEGATNDDTPTFTFVASEPGVTFECGFNGAFSDCTSPYTSDGIGDGEHTFRARATDAAGNVEASADSRSFTLDRNPPTTSITSGPSGVTGDSTPTFGFTSPEPGATFECRVDDAAFEACTNPHTSAELADGAHVFSVRSVDAVGNVDPIPAAIAFTVDTVAPDTEISSGPNGLIHDRTPSFSFPYTDGALSHECRVDDEPFTSCTSPMTTDPLGDGEHTFEVRGTDGGGNVDPTPAKRTFTVDTEIFRTGITAGPAGLTADATPTFAFATPDPHSTFACRIAPAPFVDCTSPYTAPALSDGNHTFEVRASDSYGNVEPTPAQRTFTVDSTAPDTTVDSGPTGTIDDRTPTFGFGSPDADATFECRVDAALFAPCTSPHTTAPLANGDHTFQVRAVDAAGNTDTTPPGRTFTVDVDTTAPRTRIDAGPADITHQVAVTFTFSADEPATFECRLDAGSFTPCASGVAFGPLPEGTHSFAVRARDLAGNVEPVPATTSWIIDTTPPRTTITGGPSPLSLSTRATLAFTSTEGGSRFECRLDAGAWQSCQSPTVYAGLRAGQHTVAVRAVDPAGNTDPSPAQLCWLTLGLLPF